MEQPGISFCETLNPKKDFAGSLVSKAMGNKKRRFQKRLDDFF